MGGLSFEVEPEVQASAPDRADIACFVGFVARRPAASPTAATPYTPVPPSVLAWLAARGYPCVAGAPSAPPLSIGPQDPLLDVPVPIEDFRVFDQLFAWERRALVGADGVAVGTYLGAAVRTFFAQGGRRCYVVRAGDPWSPAARGAERIGKLHGLALTAVPGGVDAPPPVAVDRPSWRGVGHLFGLPDVAFLCLPDLTDIVAQDPAPISPPPAPPAAPESFAPCSPPPPAAPSDNVGSLVRAPRCDAAGYATWAAVLQQLVRLVRQTPLREVQIVAAIPLPAPGADTDLYRLLLRLPAAPGATSPVLLSAWSPGTPQPVHADTESAFLQLAYPWVKTPASANLPEGLESPDAVLAGVLARSALLRGAFRSVIGQPLGDVFDVVPVQTRADLSWTAPDGTVLGDRVSLLGRTPGGLTVLSDVTTHPGSYRQAGVNRLLSAIVRAARRVGEAVAFEPSGPATWGVVVRGMRSVLERLTAAGALRGDTPYAVRCDRTTMTQADLDAGRLIIEVGFTPSPAIDAIVVALALARDGTVSVAQGGAS